MTEQTWLDALSEALAAVDGERSGLAPGQLPDYRVEAQRIAVMLARHGIVLRGREETDGEIDLTGEAIRCTREARGMSAAELAKAAGLTRKAIHNIEAGRTKPQSESAWRLRIALGL